MSCPAGYISFRHTNDADFLHHSITHADGRYWLEEHEAKTLCDTNPDCHGLLTRTQDNKLIMRRAMTHHKIFGDNEDANERFCVKNKSLLQLSSTRHPSRKYIVKSNDDLKTVLHTTIASGTIFLIVVLIIVLSVVLIIIYRMLTKKSIQPTAAPLSKTPTPFNSPAMTPN
jgi:hypothetical protein